MLSRRPDSPLAHRVRWSIIVVVIVVAGLVVTGGAFYVLQDQHQSRTLAQENRRLLDEISARVHLDERVTEERRLDNCGQKKDLYAGQIGIIAFAADELGATRAQHDKAISDYVRQHPAPVC
jgi:hypothetical protein